MNRVTGILNKHFGDGVVETLLKVNSNGDNRATGSFMTNEGQVFNFEINGDEDFVEVEHNHRDSEQVDDYYRGMLQSKGIEYHGDSAYLYYLGRTGEDVRCDMGGACPGGGTRCGKRCLPQGQKCRISAGGAAKGVGKAALAVGAIGGAALAARAIRNKVDPTIGQMYNNSQAKAVKTLKSHKNPLAKAYGSAVEANIKSNKAADESIRSTAKILENAKNPVLKTAGKGLGAVIKGSDEVSNIRKSQLKSSKSKKS